jgi:hypothetical protein
MADILLLVGFIALYRSITEGVSAASTTPTMIPASSGHSLLGLA